jgi:hypothetical protein
MKHFSALVVVGSLGVTLGVTPVLAGGVTPHQAFYEMHLDGRMQNSSVVNVLGKSAFIVERDCDGWLSTEDYVIEFVTEGGNSDQILSHFESWEAVSGDKYSFDVIEESTFYGRKDYGGFANLAAGSMGNAFFSMAPDSELELPEGTFFPVQHMQRILEAADAGKTMMAATIFTGGEPDDALMKASAVVGGWQEAEANIDFGSLSATGYWPVQIAYFKLSATGSEPEYEIKFLMQPNGVIRSYIIDYGDFSIAADITQIEGLDAPVCG